MRIAFASEQKNGIKSELAQHFGRCPYYIIIELDKNNTVTNVEELDNPYYNEHSPGVVPQYIAKQKADVMIAGGMGGRAVDFFNQFGIEVVTGATGTIEGILNNYLSGEIKGYKPCSEGGKGDCH